jgi:hypothetical protein
MVVHPRRRTLVVLFQQYSSDLEYFNQNTTIRTMRLFVVDDSVAFAGAAASTLPSAGTVKAPGGAGIGGAIYASREVATGIFTLRPTPPRMRFKSATQTGACSSFTGGCIV